MLSDVRLTLRWLRRSPGLAAVAVGTLTVAIGASVAAFAIVDKVLLRPLPVRDADRVVVVWPRERATPTTIGEVSYTTFRSWQQDARGFEQLAAMGSTNWGLVLQEGEPATLPAAAVSASFFRSPVRARLSAARSERRTIARVAPVSRFSATAPGSGASAPTRRSSAGRSGFATPSTPWSA